MKTFLLGVILVGVVVTIAQLVPVDSDSTYVREDTVEVIEAEEPTVEVDTIEEARKDLERINAELDVKEQELLEQKKAIDAELERLRETRVSFQ